MQTEGEKNKETHETVEKWKDYKKKKGYQLNQNKDQILGKKTHQWMHQEQFCVPVVA